MVDLSASKELVAFPGTALPVKIMEERESPFTNMCAFQKVESTEKAIVRVTTLGSTAIE